MCGIILLLMDTSDLMNSPMGVAHIKFKLQHMNDPSSKNMYISSFVFFECFVWCVGVVWNFRYATYLYDNRDLFKNNLHKLEPS